MKKSLLAANKPRFSDFKSLPRLKVIADMKEALEIPHDASLFVAFNALIHFCLHQKDLTSIVSTFTKKELQQLKLLEVLFKVNIAVVKFSNFDDEISKKFIDEIRKVASHLIKIYASFMKEPTLSGEPYPWHAFDVISFCNSSPHTQPKENWLLEKLQLLKNSWFENRREQEHR